MGKILNTTYHESVEKVTGFYSNLVNNPFYVLNDKKPVICTYYNINKDYSSLDPGSKIHMDNLGSQSPIRYNRIYDFIIYGFNRIELNSDNGDFGLEDDKIEGECYILPNTIIPTEGDYFEVSHIKDSTWLFMVKDVQQDTLQNGSNVYKISYRLEYLDNTDIKSRIIYNFRMIEQREGTNISKIVRCEDYDIAKIMDEKAVMLKGYFIDLFYNKKVQTFIYMDSNSFRTYDPYMIEFLIRNKVLADGEDSYIHVDHKIFVPNTFGLDYDRTFFRIFEKNNKDRLIRSQYTTYLEEIHSYGTLFASRYESYFKAEYGDDIRPGFNTSCVDEDLIYHIQDNELFTEKSDLWKNIIIKYFNKGILNTDELESIEDFDFKFAKEAFYMIPLLIFCLEKYIEITLK